MNESTASWDAHAHGYSVQEVQKELIYPTFLHFFKTWKTVNIFYWDTAMFTDEHTINE